MQLGQKELFLRGKKKKRMGKVKGQFFYLFTSVETGHLGQLGGNVPVGAAPTASERAADGGAWSLAVAAEQNMRKSEPKFPLGCRNQREPSQFALSFQGQKTQKIYTLLLEYTTAATNNSIVGRFQILATTIRRRRLWESRGQIWRNLTTSFFLELWCRTGQGPGETHNIPRALVNSNRTDKRSKQKQFRFL